VRRFSLGSDARSEFGGFCAHDGHIAAQVVYRTERPVDPRHSIPNTRASDCSIARLKFNGLATSVHRIAAGFSERPLPG
jgi:hypothetical protein